MKTSLFLYSYFREIRNTEADLLFVNTAFDIHSPESFSSFVNVLVTKYLPLL